MIDDYLPAERPFTGRKALLIILAFFGTIIAVNGVMLTLAVRNFGGLVVDNSYVASQRFNGDAAAAAAQPIRGWRITPEIGADRVAFELVEPSGSPVWLPSLAVEFSRPAHERETTYFTLEPARPGVYVADATLAPGQWRARLETPDGQIRTLRIHIPEPVR